jgi:hypothetical protein
LTESSLSLAKRGRVEIGQSLERYYPVRVQIYLQEYTTIALYITIHHYLSTQELQPLLGSLADPGSHYIWNLPLDRPESTVTFQD